MAVFAAGAHAESVVSARGSVTLREEARRVHFEEPVYPPAERAAEIEADVFVPVHVNAKGEVYWTATQDKSALYEAAVAAVRKWRYEPSEHVARSFSAKVRFRLPHKPVHKLPTVALLDQWSGEHAGRAEAARELTDRGMAILPDLARELKAADIERRCSAGHWLAPLGPAARKAAPALLDLVREVAAQHENTGWCPGMGAALARVDPSGFAAELERAVRGRDPKLCRILLNGQSYERDAPAALFEAFAIEGCVEKAVMAISGLEDPNALTPLLRLTSHESPIVRRTALYAVARTTAGLPGQERGPWITDLNHALVIGLGDADPGVRHSAAMGFQQLPGETAAGVPALVRALEDPKRDVRSRVLLALTAMGYRARAAGPALLKALDSPLPPEENVRQGLDDEVMGKLVQSAIAATGAGKNDARLAAEDEVRASVVAYMASRWRKTPGGETRPFSVTVLRQPASPALIAALARRGLAPTPGGMSVTLEEVVWKAGDLAEVDATVGRAMEWSQATYGVGLQDAAWTVVAVRQGPIS